MYTLSSKSLTFGPPSAFQHLGVWKPATKVWDTIKKTVQSAKCRDNVPRLLPSTCGNKHLIYFRRYLIRNRLDSYWRSYNSIGVFYFLTAPIPQFCRCIFPEGRGCESRLYLVWLECICSCGRVQRVFDS